MAVHDPHAEPDVEVTIGTASDVATTRSITIRPQPAVMTLQVGTPTVMLRNHFAPLHLWTARRNARLCREHENVDADLFERRSLVLTAIFFATAYLEGLINEVIMDTTDPKQPTPSGIPTSAIPAFNKLRKHSAVMPKYQAALTAVARPEYAEGRDPFRSARQLVLMRNHFVHYKPEWREGTHEYELRLDAEVAEWAVATANRFAKSWWNRMRLKGQHDATQGTMPTP
jgi:hypothetical protein